MHQDHHQLGIFSPIIFTQKNLWQTKYDWGGGGTARVSNVFTYFMFLAQTKSNQKLNLTHCITTQIY